MRLRLAFCAVVLVWIVLLVRIYYLSIKSNEYYAEIAEDNVVRTKLIAPTRGQILDSKGRPIAINRLGFSISLAPHLKQDVRMVEIEKIVSIFPDQNATLLEKEYKKQNSPYNQDFIQIVDFIDYDTVLPHFAELNLRPNLKLDSSSKRHYPYNFLASHIIGYVGRSTTKDMEKDSLAKLTNYVGRSGVEAFYNNVLQGSSGVRKTKVTALNQVVEEILYEKPKSQDIALNIDMELQQFLKDTFGDAAGAAVVMDVNTGAIIAAGSFPEYNLNPFVTGITQKEWDGLIQDLKHPFTNKLVNGLYPPGSVIKMGVGMSFLNSGKIGREKTYFCGGYIELGKRKFRCWKASGHGNMNLNDAIRESCDVYFYEGSLEVGIDFIAQNLERYGFGKKTGVDLPNEFVGTVPSKAWKMEKYNQQWFMGETVNASIGQGYFLTTPMQVAKYTAEIASGKGLTPHFLKSIDGKDVEFKPTELFTPFEKEQLPYIRKAMYEVANHPKGTVYRLLKDNIVPIAAKTGTAQVISIPQSEIVRMKEKDMEYFHRSHAWMTTYGPYDNPQYAVTVMVEHGGGGGSAGGPIIKKIYKKLVEMGYIKLPEVVEKTVKKGKK
ncbi:penicillin-binding protein 2 [Campylobacter geochelonis]|uniref:Penicillin-binding protein 2 n=1 Tax=Campylobacter geochelonis TaxID=1780362 RepID=A0A128ERE8_9BACT|nr:penicillin-binding protein 2 [Campylobacter geochelonis]QKF71671.1 penicillin-binding protein 2 [Campylobacter geochelonis]CZE49263.1 penicillin-binding protein 2 [Campylobacter geochelonis]CZE51289.1 penicillin-binding protein 2 [Campylobacter geochelonis]